MVEKIQNFDKDHKEQAYELKLEEKKNSYDISINDRKYKIDIGEHMEDFPNFFEIFFNIIDFNPEKIANFMWEKKQKRPFLCSTVEYDFISNFEFYIITIQKLIESLKLKKTKSMKISEFEKDKCCICLNEFYENMEKFDFNSIISNLKNTSPSDPIIFPKCQNHYFHFECIKPYCDGKDFVKCPICNQIYGTMTGDNIEGRMDVDIAKHIHCAGYEKFGTIIINYNMKSGKKNGIFYPSIHRTAYLPNCPEGKEVLDLLKQAFDRKLIFRVGDSITSGRKNVIVWNGIHHKTALFGGSSHYGYPDETYFMRVKSELADKGIK